MAQNTKIKIENENIVSNDNTIPLIKTNCAIEPTQKPEISSELRNRIKFEENTIINTITNNEKNSEKTISWIREQRSRKLPIIKITSAIQESQFVLMIVVYGDALLLSMFDILQKPQEKCLDENSYQYILQSLQISKKILTISITLGITLWNFQRRFSISQKEFLNRIIQREETDNVEKKNKIIYISYFGIYIQLTHLFCFIIMVCTMEQLFSTSVLSTVLLRDIRTNTISISRIIELWFVYPIREELLFRIFILTYIWSYIPGKENIDKIQSSILLSIFFAGIHSIQFFSPYLTARYVILQISSGFFLGYLYSLRSITVGISETIILHILNNIISSFLNPYVILYSKKVVTFMFLIETFGILIYQCKQASEELLQQPSRRFIINKE